MSQPARTAVVQPDDFIVCTAGGCLEGWLHGALAVCVHDEVRALGGLMHLRLGVSSGVMHDCLEPTDNTLSSSLLLLETFCRQLRATGARPARWQVRVFCHSEAAQGDATATVLDLVRAYFTPSPRPVECRLLTHPQGVQVRLRVATGQLWVQAAVGRGQARGNARP